MKRSLIAGVALAAAVTAVVQAEAGHRRTAVTYRPNCATPVYGGWTAQPAPVYTGSVMPAPAPVVGTAQPPVASGNGQVIRRFSVEPDGAPAAEIPTAAAPAYTPAPAYSPAPAYAPSRSSASSPSLRAAEQGRGVGGLTGEARLRPGRGWGR